MSKTIKPLTLEELRQMDGKPAYWPDDNSWGIISVDSEGRWAGMPFFRGRKNGCNFEYDIEGRKMILYPFSPKYKDEKMLTENSLKEMVGKPIWLETWKRSEWVLLHGFHGPEVYGRGFIFTRRTGEKVTLKFSELGREWKAYNFCPHCGARMKGK